MKSFFYTLIFSAFLIISPSSYSHTPLPAKLQTYIAHIESEKEHLQGGAIAIVHNGKVVYQTTFGHPKDDTGKITPQTLFPLASVSKPVSALGIALLVKEGRLSYSQKVALPYFKNPVTLTQIMNHSTGYFFTGNAQIEQGMTRENLLKTLKKQPAKCPPGQCYFYSNTVYGLVEEALNTRNLTLNDALGALRKALKTTNIKTVPLAPNLAIALPHMSVHKNGVATLKQKGLPPYYPKATPAGAGVFASLEAMIDVLKLASGKRPDIAPFSTFEPLYEPLMLNKDIEKWQITQIKDIKKIQSYYGRGWRVLKKQNHPGKDLIFHSGALSGVSTFIGFIPSQDIGIVILLNQGGGWATRSGLVFWDGLFDSFKSSNNRANNQAS